MAIVHDPASYRVKRPHKKAATDSAADRAKALRTTKRILRQVSAGGDGNFGGRNLRAGQKREPPP
jgi:hypothetical protein